MKILAALLALLLSGCVVGVTPEGHATEKKAGSCASVTRYDDALALISIGYTCEGEHDSAVCCLSPPQCETWTCDNEGIR